MRKVIKHKDYQKISTINTFSTSARKSSKGDILQNVGMNIEVKQWICINQNM